LLQLYEHAAIAASPGRHGAWLRLAWLNCCVGLNFSPSVPICP